MWRLVLLAGVIWLANAEPQIAEEIQINGRPVRQLDQGECCPCPKQDGLETDKNARDADMEMVPDNAGSSSMLTPRYRAADCPCRGRDAEPSASSLFDLPSQAFAALIRPDESKEDPKPLLHPEVGLASSVLETLREATDEEYREALARDAARSFLRSSEPDLFPEQVQEASRNIVTIVLNPLTDSDNDVLASGTHFHTSRCIHPLESTRTLGSSKPGLLSSIFEPSPNSFGLDSGFAASDVRETVMQGTDEGTKGNIPQLLSKSNKLSEDTRSNKQDSVFKVSSPDFNTGNNILQDVRKHLKSGVPKLGLNHLKNNLNDREDNQEKDSVSNLKIYNGYSKVSVGGTESQDPNTNLDKDAFKGGSKNHLKFKTVQKSNLPETFNKPTLARNIAKLKDVQLIPKNYNHDDAMKSKSNVPDLQLPTLDELLRPAQIVTPRPIHLPHLSDLFRNTFKVYPEKPNKKISKQVAADKDDIEEEEKSPSNIHTEILDTVPSPSQNEISAQRNPQTPSQAEADSNQNLDEKIPNNENKQELNDSSTDNNESASNTIEDDSGSAINLISTVLNVVDSDIVENNSKDAQGMATKNNEEDNSSNKISTLLPNLDLSRNAGEIQNRLRSNSLNVLDKLKVNSLSNVRDQTDSSNDKGTVNDFDQDNLERPDDETQSASVIDLVKTPLTLKDLKTMSDSLLHESTRNNNGIQNLLNPDTATDIDLSDVSNKSADKDDVNQHSNTSNDSNENETVQTNETNSCPSGISAPSSKDVESLTEMASEASVSLGRTVKQNSPSLLENLLRDNPTSVESNPLSVISNVLKPLNLNVDRGLPSIDDLRKGIEDIFEQSSLSKPESDAQNVKEDTGEIVEPPTSPSERNSKFAFPVQEPLKELDFDIFRLHPLNLGKSKSSGLNINRLRAKVPIQNTGLNPLKLQSTVGKKDGLLGASLSLSPINEMSTRKGGKSKGLLKIPQSTGLEALPTLEDLTSHLRSQTQSILKASNNIFDSKSLQDPLKHLESIRETVQSRTADAMSSLQQSLASSLNEAKIANDNLLNNPKYAQPENSLSDALSQARWDVDDKLKELHSNFADHLSSIQGKLRESSLALPSTRNVQTMQPSKKTSKSGRPKPDSRMLSSIGRESVKAKPRASAKKPERLILPKTDPVKERNILGNSLPNKGRFTVRKPEPRSKPELNPSTPKKSKIETTKTLPKPFPWSKSSTDLKTDKLVSKPLKALKPTERHQMPQLKVPPASPTPEIKRIKWNRPLGKSSDSERFKAALFSTTTPFPMPRINSPFRAASLISTTKAPIQHFRNVHQTPTFDTISFRSRLQETPIFQPKFPKDPHGFPSEQILSKTLPEKIQSGLLKLEKGKERLRLAKNERKSLLKPDIKVDISKMELPEVNKRASSKPIVVKKGKSKADFKLAATDPTIEKETGSRNPIELNVDSTILDKLRESVRSKLAEVNKENSKLRSTDMSEGASDRLQTKVLSGDLLKENVPYKCDLVCKRENNN